MNVTLNAISTATEPRVSVVVATHNRPDTLRAALTSVLAQSMPDFELLVIGDACDERTLAVVRSLADRRIRYVNLPVWCGEQAVPNSIGMRLATAPWIALLNHDDLWLPDHLALALDALSQGGDFHVARSATAHASREGADGSVEPVFSELSDPHLRLAGIFGGVQGFEPASAWVFRRDLVARVGLWRSARRLIDKPIENWLKRAFRARVALTAGQQVTVLKLQTHWSRMQGRGAAYGVPSPEHATLTRMLQTEFADAVRAHVLAVIATAPAPAQSVGRPGPRVKAAVRALKPWLYFCTGLDVDLLRQRLRGVRPGAWFERVTVARTGKPLPEAADFDALLADAREQLRHDR